MAVNNKVKENLWRLWASAEVANHDLAIHLFLGLKPTLVDYEWLWQEVLPFVNQQKKERTRLANFPNISTSDILQGKLLAILLEQEQIVPAVAAHYTQHNRLRLPYTSLEYIPKTFVQIASTIQEFIWQDGELTRIDEHIIHFKNLRRIDFRRQPISFIHPYLATLPMLEEIHLVSTSFLPDEMLDRSDIEIFTDAPY